MYEIFISFPINTTVCFSFGSTRDSRQSFVFGVCSLTPQLLREGANLALLKVDCVYIILGRFILILNDDRLNSLSASLLARTSGIL